MVLVLRLGFKGFRFTTGRGRLEVGHGIVQSGRISRNYNKSEIEAKNENISDPAENPKPERP